HIGVDVPGVVEHVRGANDVVQKSVRRGHARAQRQMVHQLRDEVWLGGGFLDLLLYSVCSLRVHFGVCPRLVPASMTISGSMPITTRFMIQDLDGGVVRRWRL